MRIEVAGTVRLEDLRAAYQTVLKQTPLIRFKNASGEQGLSRGAKLFILLLLICTGGLLLQHLSEAPDPLTGLKELVGTFQPCVFLVLGIVGLALALIVGMRVYRWRILNVELPRSYQANQRLFEQTLLFDDAGFTLKTPLKEELYSWSDIHSAELTDVGILLHDFENSVPGATRQRQADSKGTKFRLLPRHFFSDSEYQELYDFLAKRFETARTN